MQKRTFDNNWIGHVTGLILLLITFIFTFYQLDRVTVFTQEVRDNTRLMNQLERLLIHNRNFETRYREFFLSKQESVVQVFERAYAEASKDLDSLIILASPLSRAELNDIGFLMEDARSKIKEGMAHYRQNTYKIDDKLLNINIEILNKMERIASNIIDIHQKEAGLLENSYQKLQRAGRTVKYINVILLILAISLAIYSLISYTKEHNAKKIADDRNKAYAAELEERIHQLDQANKELSTLRSLEKFAATGRIARTIAHEVRNPLTNINLAADQMKSHFRNEEAELLIGMILRNSNRINQLISDLLNSTKFLELNLSSYPIHQLLDETLEMARDRIDLQQIRVEKKYADQSCVLNIDVEKMKIAFLNLFVNAIEAMQPGRGVLTVRTSATTNKCIIVVSDNGSGIDKESLNRLFEPYFTNKAKGSGLGLTNTHNIIYTHKGTIEVISALNYGTTFTVSLNK